MTATPGGPARFDAVDLIKDSVTGRQIEIVFHNHTG